jgi:transcriptional regulator with XRE-family HTH domain
VIHPMVIDLAEERKRRNFPASWAGQRAGLGKNTVGQWERGERNPSLIEISQYAFSLGYAVTLTPIEEVARGDV